jgi:chromosome segregation ATPase
MKIDRLPPNTCPLIDTVIKDINSSISYAVKRYDDLEEAESAMQDICWALEGLEDKLEEIRRANSSLRSEAEDAIAEVELLEKELSSLERIAYE